jgi:hypothetical protein
MLSGAGTTSVIVPNVLLGTPSFCTGAQHGVEEAFMMRSFDSAPAEIIWRRIAAASLPDRGLMEASVG